ncbi:Protease 3 precursor [Planctopirus ephydatiae]|uniref:Protease 3 n=2 Tax=Planctopirus ephydatiae TaxID=2528019 RepID=A0A518GKI8_9PLAN|nr:Protease 3 precursor [Planctopirus ephydatiae]
MIRRTMRLLNQVTAQAVLAPALSTRMFLTRKGLTSRQSVLSGAARLSLLAMVIGSQIIFCSSSSKAEMPMKVTEIEGISEYKLENGLRVLLFPDPSKPTVTVNLTVFVGSRHEGYGEAGMAHLLEHMLFKGTPDVPSVPKALQERGADFNGTTWLDRTNYFETLPAQGDNLEFAIRLEADRMMNSHVKGEDLTSEMTVVRNEFERGENSPASILGQRMMAAAFEWHNYGKSTIGNRADIERVPVERLKSFYRKYYQPDNAMLVVAGRFEPKEALRIIGETFGKIPRPTRVLDNTYTEEPAQDGERQVVLRRVGDVAVVGAVYHIPSGAHPDFVAIDVLESILTMQPSGRLYKALVQGKKAASVSGAAYALHDPGVLRFMAEVAAGNDPQVVLDSMLDILNETASKGVTQEELERARLRLLKQREMGASDSAEIAIELSEWAAQGDWRLYFLYRDRLEAVTVDDVNRVAKAYLQPSNRTVGLYIPTEKPERTSVPATPELAKMIGDYKGREETSVGEAFDVSPLAIEERTLRTRIDGVQVAMLPKKTRSSTVVLRLTLRYGNEKSLFGLAKACEFLPPMMLRGTKSLTRQQLQDALDKNFASLSAGGNAGEATFVIETKRQNLVAVLGLLKQVLREPAFPESELAVIKQQVRANLEQGLTDPQTLAVKTVSKALSPYPAGDVRSVPTVEEELKLVEAIEVEGLKRLYNDFLSAQVGQIAVVGDFDPAEVESAFKGVLADWKSDQTYERISRTGSVPITAEVKRIQIPDKANAFYFGGAVMPMSDDHPDYPAMIVGNYVLGAGALSSRLGDRIRQKEGLSYGVGSAFRAGMLDQRATLSLYAIANPANMEKVNAAVNEELARLLKEGVTQQELDAAKQGYLQAQQVGRTEDPKIARLLEENLYAGRTMQYVAKLETAIADLTTEKVLEAVRRHIHPNQILTVIAGDLAKE